MGNKPTTLIFDVKGDFLWLTKQGFIVLKKGDVRLAPFQAHNARSVEDIIEYIKLIVALICDIIFLGATGGPLLQRALRACYQEKGCFKGSQRWPTWTDIRKKVRQIAAEEKYKGTTTTDVLSKIDIRSQHFEESGEIFNCERGYPLSFYKNNNIIFDMRGYSLMEAQLLAIGLAIMIFRDNLKNNIRSTTPLTIFVFDEGYWIFDREMDDNQFVSNDSIKTLFRQAREFGLFFLVSAQQIGSVSKYVLENLSTVFCFKTGNEGVDDKNSSDSTTSKHNLSTNSLKVFEGIVRFSDFHHPVLFEMVVDKFPDKSITDEEIRAKAAPIVEKLLEEIGANKPPDYDPDETYKKNIISLYVVRVMKFLGKYPFIHITGIREHSDLEDLKLTSEKMSLIRDEVKEEKLIQTIECVHNKKGQKAEYWALTERAQEGLRIPLLKRIHHTHFEHSLYQKRLEEFLKAKGFKNVVREYNPTNNPASGRTDVYCENLTGERIGWELTLSFSNLIENAIRNLTLFAMDELNLVFRDRKNLEKGRAIIDNSETFPKHHMNKVIFSTINNYL